MQRSPADPMTDPRDLISAATPLPWHESPVFEPDADERLLLYAVNHLPALLDVADALVSVVALIVFGVIIYRLLESRDD